MNNIEIIINLDWVMPFLDSNFFQTIAVILGAVIVYFIYKSQKSDTTYNAAALIVLEISSIESNINQLKTASNQEEFLQTSSIFQSIDWFKLRGTLVSQLDIIHIESINRFYEQVIVLEDARKFFRESVYLTRTAKIEATQIEVANMLREDTNVFFDKITKEALEDDAYSCSIHKPLELLSKVDSYLISKLSTYKQLYDKHSVDFLPLSVVNYFDKAKNEYAPISNTPAFEELRKLANKKKG